jgi:hypothetical protein
MYGAGLNPVKSREVAESIRCLSMQILCLCKYNLHVLNGYHLFTCYFAGVMESAMMLLLDASSAGWAALQNDHAAGHQGLTAANYVEQASETLAGHSF